MNQEEREQLKAELREEILEEMTNKSRKTAPGLKKVYEKWFFGPDKKDKFKNSKMEQAFGRSMSWKAWEGIRALAKTHFGISYQSQLINVNQDELERVADAICQLVYSLKVNQQKEGE